MPIAGDTVTALARRSAMLKVGTVLGRAAHTADRAGDPLLQAQSRAPFTMREITPKQLDRLAAKMRRNLVWVDEGNCFNRAMFGAHLLNGKLRTGTSPMDDVFAGAIAINPHVHDGGDYTGGFHAALAVKVRGEDELQALDLLPNVRNAGIIPLSEWSSHPEPMLLRPFAGTGIFDGVNQRATFVNGDGFRFGIDQLRATWKAAVPYHGQYRLVDPPV